MKIDHKANLSSIYLYVELDECLLHVKNVFCFCGYINFCLFFSKKMLYVFK